MRFIMGVDINGNHFYSECDVTEEQFKGDAAEFLERFGMPVLAHLNFQVEKNIQSYRTDECAMIPENTPPLSDETLRDFANAIDAGGAQ